MEKTLSNKSGSKTVTVFFQYVETLMSFSKICKEFAKKLRPFETLLTRIADQISRTRKNMNILLEINDDVVTLETHEMKKAYVEEWAAKTYPNNTVFINNVKGSIVSKTGKRLL